MFFKIYLEKNTLKNWRKIVNRVCKRRLEERSVMEELQKHIRFYCPYEKCEYFSSEITNPLDELFELNEQGEFCFLQW